MDVLSLGKPIMNVSIIITCHNRENHVGRAIRSAIDQAFPAGMFEVVVVDNKSTDHSAEIIRDFGDAIVPVFHEVDKGLPAARNSGIRKAKGRFIVHLDSDDYVHANLISVESQFLEYNGEWGAVACDYLLVDAYEHHLLRVSAKEDPIACGVMFRKDWLISIGLYDESMLRCGDEELRARFEERYTVGHIPLPYYRYTRHDGNMTKDYSPVAEYKRLLEERRDQT